MELERRSWQKLNYFTVDLKGHLGYFYYDFLDVFAEFLNYLNKY